MTLRGYGVHLSSTMRRLGFLVILASLGIGSPARAEGDRVTLRDTLAQAVKGNRTLVSSSIDVTITEAQITQARGIDDFVIDASANVFFERKEAFVGQSPFAPTATDRVDLSGGVSRNLSDGGRVGLKVEATYTHTQFPFSFMLPDGSMTDVATEYKPTVLLSFFQPILRGFGEKTARAPRRRAEAARDVATLQRAQTAGNVVRDVVSAYWDLAYAQRNVEIGRASLALAREQLRITQARLDVGVGAPTDLAAVEQTIATREAELLAGELAIADRALELRRLVGLEISVTSMGLEAIDRLEPAGGDLALDEAFTRAKAANPELAVVRAQGRAAQIEVEVTENGLLPQLDFNATAGPAGNADNMGEALGQIGTFDSYSVQAGLVLSVPIGNRAAKGARDVARGQLRKVKLSEADIEAQVAVAVARSVNLVATTRKQLEALEKATRLAQVNLDAEKARFDVGKSTNFDVLARQEELSQAELRRARAQADYLKAVAQLQTLTGDILPGYGVELKAQK